MIFSTTPRPMLFYGYITVLVSTIVIALTFGVNYSFGIFFTPLRAEFGWTKAVTSAAYSILTVLAGFTGIFAGRLADRLGTRGISIAGGCFLGLGCVLMSQVNSAWQFYLIYGLILSPGIGIPWPSLTAAVPKWFVRRRGLMAGIVASGTGFAAIIVPPLVSRLIPLYGWRHTYIIMGLSTVILVVIAAMFMRRDPHHLGQPLYGSERTNQEKKPEAAGTLSYREIAHNRRIWMVCIIYFCFGVALHTIMVHIVPHAIETGISPGTAAGLMVLIGVSSIVSKLMVGEISNRIGVRWALAYNFVFLIAGLIWLQVSERFTTLQGFAIAFGIAYGGIMALQSVLSADLFGLNSLGVIVGAVTFIYTLGSATGPFLSSYLFDVTGSYRIPFLICTLLEAVALVVVLTALRKEKR